MKIFAIERELRRIQNRGHFIVPLTLPLGNKIETSHDKDRVLETVDEEITEMLNTVKRSRTTMKRNKNKPGSETSN